MGKTIKDVSSIRIVGTWKVSSEYVPNNWLEISTNTDKKTDKDESVASIDQHASVPYLIREDICP